MISLDDWMLRHHGIAHTRTLRDAGFTPRAIADAVATGHYYRVRRSWLVASGCSPERRHAATVSGRITCVSAAAETGLWVPEHTATHVAVPATASRFDAGNLVLHWAHGPIPVPPRTTVEPMLNVLFQVARCLQPADALAVWESALRHGQVTRDELSRTHWGCVMATRLAGLASTESDSGLETRFVWLMRQIGVEVQQQVWVDGHPLDGLIGKRLAVQLDGFEHHSSARDRRRDLRADARLTLLGYSVLRFDFHQLMNTPEYVITTVQNAIAQRLHEVPRPR